MEPQHASHLSADHPSSKPEQSSSKPPQLQPSGSPQQLSSNHQHPNPPINMRLPITLAVAAVIALAVAGRAYQSSCPMAYMHMALTQITAIQIPRAGNKTLGTRNTCIAEYKRCIRSAAKGEPNACCEPMKCLGLNMYFPTDSQGECRTVSPKL